jgi:hypothetical protein
MAYDPSLFPGDAFPLFGPWPPVRVQEQILSASVQQFPTSLRVNPQSIIWLEINISGYGGTDVASLRFNGDSGTNYWSRFITAAQGTSTLSNVENVSDTLIRLGPTTNKGRSALVRITNFAGKTKVVNILNTIGSGLAGTASTITLAGSGEWINLTDPIQTIDILTQGGTVTMLTGSSVALLGWQRSS